MKYLYFIAGLGTGLFFYKKANDSYNAAMKDRDALLSMLSPEQKDIIINGLSQVSNIVKDVTPQNLDQSMINVTKQPTATAGVRG